MRTQMFCIAVLLCCLSTGVLLVGCGGGGGDIGPLIAAIVFMRATEAGNEDGAVWAMRPDGSDKVEIDDPTYDIFQAVLSPDGTRLVATAWTVLRVLNLQTGNWSTPYDSPDDCATTPSFSPDSSQIIFSESEDDEDTYDIWTVPVGGGGANKVRNATTTGDYFLLPSYNQAGTKIVFQYNEDEWGDQSVAVMDPDGSDLDQLADDAMHPSFLPDGRIMYINLASSNQIWVMDADGSNKHALAGTPNNVSFPTCSADGTSIAYAQGPSTSRNILVAPFDGTTIGAPVDRTADTGDACWRPAFGLIGTNVYPN